MSKIFISFLGTSDYTPCNYIFKDKKIENVHFVQEALVRLFCDNFRETDRIVIFLTEEAKKTNWYRLQKNLKKIETKTEIKSIGIPKGDSEAEIWEIFSIIYSEIKENDEVIFDITHSFRSIPMLGIVLLNYARFLKDIKVKGIYYGAFEILGPKKIVEKMPKEKRNAPIFDLTSFDKLQQWSNAAENFVNHGITEKMCNLVYEDVNPILQEDYTNKQARYASNFAKMLNKISSYFNTVRGKLIIEGKDFIYLKNNIENLNIERSISKPLKPLKEKILNKMEPYEKNNILNGFKAVEWCIDNGLIQQGITLLQETIVTHILESMQIPWDKIKNRDIVSCSTKVFCENQSYEEWNTKLKDNTELTKRITSNEIFKSLAKPYDTLRDFRNDINHGGYLRNARPAGCFKNKLQEIYKEVKTIVFEENS